MLRSRGCVQYAKIYKTLKIEDTLYLKGDTDLQLDLLSLVVIMKI